MLLPQLKKWVPCCWDVSIQMGFTWFQHHMILKAFPKFGGLKVEVFWLSKIHGKISYTAYTPNIGLPHMFGPQGLVYHLTHGWCVPSFPGLTGRACRQLNNQTNIWLVVWNMNFVFPYIGNNNPNWLIFCQRGWSHQPDMVRKPKRLNWENNMFTSVAEIATSLGSNWHAECVNCYKRFVFKASSLSEFLTFFLSGSHRSHAVRRCQQGHTFESRWSNVEMQSLKTAIV